MGVGKITVAEDEAAKQHVHIAVAADVFSLHLWVVD